MTHICRTIIDVAATHCSRMQLAEARCPPVLQDGLKLAGGGML